ncbi:hypothetical protein [Rubrivirga sp.]|uniref:hypothetical protein n=1 Tax=Rubrivirga sp. TaxID=1885344 RepID=UPI003B52D151
MARARLPLLVALGVLAAGPARASDFSGAIAAWIGIPGLAVANVVAVGFLIARATRTRTVVALALLVPTALAGGLLAEDALSMLRYSDLGRIVVTFFSLLAALVVQIALLSRRLAMLPRDVGQG